MAATSPNATATRNWPLYWFAVLDCAIKERDCAEIREAIKHLAELGIEVRFVLPMPEVCRDD